MASYSVTAPLRFTVEADSAQEAIDRVVDASTQMVAGHIAGLALDVKSFTYEEIIHDAGDLDAMQRWLDNSNPA